MAWPLPPTGAWNPGGVQSMPPMGNMSSYTPDQWNSMQQQNWQQWAQWQQQYAQWHSQYGDKYAAHMQTMGSISNYPPPGAPPFQPPVPPAPPPREQPPPPPPPPHENDQPLFGQPMKVNTQQTLPETTQPAPVPAPSSDGHSTGPSVAYNIVNVNKVNNQNWSQSTDTGAGSQQISSVNAEALKKLAEEERLFDIQFKKWEEEIEKWKLENVNHPDKKAYREYEEKFEACRKQLLERRQQMNEKRARLLSSVPPQSGSASSSNVQMSVPTINTDSHKEAMPKHKTDQTYQHQLNQTSNNYNKDSSKYLQSQSGYSKNNVQNMNIEYGNQYREKYIEHQQEKVNKVEQYQSNEDQYHAGGGMYNNENDEYRGENDQYQDENDQYRDENNQYRDENDQYRDENDQYKGDNNEYQDDCDNQEYQNDEYQNEEYLNENQHYQNENKDFQDSNDQYPDNNHYEDYTSDPNFLPASRATSGIPGLDLVLEETSLKNNKPVDIIEIPDDPVEIEQKKSMAPDLSKISKGINNILGDEKIMNILNMVQNQNKLNDLGKQHSSQVAQNFNVGDINQWDRSQNIPNMTFGKQNSPINRFDQGSINRFSSGNYNQNNQYLPEQPQGFYEETHHINNRNIAQNSQHTQNVNHDPQNVRPGEAVQNIRNNNIPSLLQMPVINPGGPFDRNNQYSNRPPLTVPHDNNYQGNTFNNNPNCNIRSPRETKPNTNFHYSQEAHNREIDTQSRQPLMKPNHETQNMLYPRHEQQLSYQEPVINQPPRPKWVEEPLFAPSIIVEYEHKPLRLKARDFIEPVHLFDYDHKSKNEEYKLNKDFEKEVDDLFSKKSHRPEIESTAFNRFTRDHEYSRDTSRDYERRSRNDSRDDYHYKMRDEYDKKRFEDRYNDRRRVESDKRREEVDRKRDESDRRRYDYEKNREDIDRNRDSLRDRRESRRDDRSHRDDRSRRDDKSRSRSREKDRKRGISKENETSNNLEVKKLKFNATFTCDTSAHIVMIDDLLYPPGRDIRPEKIVIILRGPPGSGKSYLAKLIRDKETQNGGQVRIMSIDDYFTQESEIEEKDESTGKTIKKPTLKYEYDESLENSYLNSLKRAFKRALTDGYFNFLIMDAVNDQLKSYADIWNFSRQCNFQVYVCTMELDPETCYKRNIHNRTLEDIQVICARFFPTPQHHIQLDPTTLLQSASITEVHMEDVDDDVIMEDIKENEVENSFTSKWERMDDATQLARLDGTSKPLRSSKLSMEDYLQLDDWQPSAVKPGKKTVRWADIEEKRQQEKMRAIGFVVGQTDWNRMTDPTMGSSALTQTKYIERVRRY